MTRRVVECDPRLGDALVERYVEWREECSAVQFAYERWREASKEDRSGAFAAYSAALDRETIAVFKRALGTLAPAQRMVVTLRDVQGWSASEVSVVLQLTDANQRVLLHRGRSRLRSILECYFTDRVESSKGGRV